MSTPTAPAPQSQQDLHRARTALRQAAMLIGRWHRTPAGQRDEQLAADVTAHLERAHHAMLATATAFHAERMSERDHAQAEATGGAR